MRKTWDIHGGIHPPENKTRSLGHAIVEVPLPDLLIVPVNQHIGAPAIPVVNAGEQVLKGQLIAEANGFVSAPVHAPSSGMVTAIKKHPTPHPLGIDSTCIIIRPDGKEQWTKRLPIANYRDLSPARLITMIRDAGITGMGGAGFPTSVKLQPQRGIDTLIINATECEPYITADDMLMRESAADIITGIDILAHILGNPRLILIGIEDNKAEAYESLEPLLKNTSIELVEFPTKYPSGGEKQLIQILTGKQVPEGKLPMDLGIVCQNVGTVHAIYQAICKGEPLISRVTTVTGNSTDKPGNYQVLTGTPVEHLLATAEYDDFTCRRLVMGGPMMGFTLNDLSVPVVKSTNCLIAADAEESPADNIPQACIRCGHCSEVCPASLLPQQLYWYARSKDYEKLTTHNLADCIECGACSYVCPSEIPLVQYYRAAKAQIHTIEQETIISDRARQRFEYHQQRMEGAEQAKLAKRQARKEAAEAARLNAAKNSNDDVETSDIVAEALAQVSSNRGSPEQQLQRLQRTLSAAESRLVHDKEKLEQCPTGDSKEAALEAAMTQSRLRRDEASNKLKNYSASDTSSEDTPRRRFDDPPEQFPIDENKVTEQVTLAIDRAGLAIQKAQQRAARQATMSEHDKLLDQRDSLTARLNKARSRCKNAEQEGDENLAAYRSAVEKLETKLTSTEQLLTEHLTAESPVTEPLDTTKSPANKVPTSSDRGAN
jgi:electron transport complex protein RnfC